MSDDLTKGDVVRLKSGGPLMTIKSVGDHYGTQTVWCVWFDQKVVQQSGSFPIEAVEKDG
jgi:uncharacterized protein YodC (DUF2158 family)